MPRLTRLVAMTASARAPGRRKSTAGPAPRRQDRDRGEEEQDDDGDDDRDQDVLAATRGQPQLHPGLCGGRRGKGCGRLIRPPRRARGRGSAGAPTSSRYASSSDPPVVRSSTISRSPEAHHAARAATTCRVGRDALESIAATVRRRRWTVAPGRTTASARARSADLVRAERPVQPEAQPRRHAGPQLGRRSRPRRSGHRPGRRSGRPAARRRSGRGWSSGSRRPRARRSATIARVVARASGSIPAVGSSRITTSGRPTRASASPSRWRSPPDSRR